MEFDGVLISEVGAKAMAALIAAKISRKMLTSAVMKNYAESRLKAIRNSAKSLKGGLGTALVLILKANGYLGIAARHSRLLQTECPKLWKLLRYRYNGIDMLTFLVRDAIQEYIDRISILEREPTTFLKMMHALIKEGKTKEIFLPA